MYFDELNLNENVLDALYDMHFDKCTPVQEKCIPEILKGKDVLGVAQTGTGKTAAYLLPVLSKLNDGGYPDKAINCLIMSPTRELAQQIDQAMQGFGYYLNGVSSVAVYGGNDGNRYDQEIKSLQLGADVVIATPGRLISHISLGNVDLSKVSFFILDEADRMLDMGFSEDIIKIAQKLPKTCQTIMFSATMPSKIEGLAKTLLKDPVELKLAVSKPAEKIKQMAYICYETQKMGIIKDIFKNGDLKRVIIFCGSKIKVKQAAGALQRKHINCGEMHSDLDQATRDDVMFKFKSGQLDVLVATDIVSRGIDIDDIAMVINYDVPHDAEDYVHRIGRTARATRTGTAITFVSEDDIYYFQQIEKFLEKDVEKIPLPVGLGESPEYKSDGKPKSGTSAKNRRRNDRDQSTHKDKKQQNYRQRNSNANYANAESEGAPKSNYPKKRIYTTDDKREYKPRNNKGEYKKDDQQSGEKKYEPRKKIDETKQPQYNKRRGNVEGNYKKRNNPQAANSKPTRTAAETHTVKPIKKENGIKKLFKKIFSVK
ncbi:MAG: DEAD/DEAH box helicase [Prevotella sp.]|jgi:superfamily II DNA/RNA helicase|nr:DEAD/DEAH box helicase [Prevotella sp.]MBP7097894.1 DEAD/DEAH box helicase [Prevotella sp.]MBP8687294.1 DEAD/DEAH box helicase [Prevotella sp.]MBP8934768.1 DEAD/DEAH box helicase [Prevotella sp.]MBP9982721.1 DEAD/DEAH box helicase [Prevotella sp.]MCI1731375.1 DEAD/DEAH box helicase [Prevotella sp.]